MSLWYGCVLRIGFLQVKARAVKGSAKEGGEGAGAPTLDSAFVSSGSKAHHQLVGLYTGPLSLDCMMSAARCELKLHRRSYWYHVSRMCLKSASTMHSTDD